PLPRLAVADLPLRVHARQEQLAVLLDHAADAQALDDVGADSDDFHGSLARVPHPESPADLSTAAAPLYNPSRSPPICSRVQVSVEGSRPWRRRPCSPTCPRPSGRPSCTWRVRC